MRAANLAKTFVLVGSLSVGVWSCNKSGGSNAGTGGTAGYGETGGVGMGRGGNGTGTGGASSGTGGASTGTGGASSGTGGTTTVQPDAFEIDGTWSYLGPSDMPHSLEISNGAMVYADEAGQWTSNWTITEYDNGLHHFQVVFESGTGTYLPVGQNMSGSYVLNSPILTVQLANGLGSYPPVQSPGACTEGSTFIPDCRLYVKQN
jgi:hypothetical protein